MMKMDNELEILFSTAKRASENAYAPYSGFKVGAALKTKLGNIFTGCNIENSSYGASMCAERTVIFKAVSENELSYHAMAIYAQSDKISPPCGICRQVMAEFSDDMIIIYGNEKEKRITHLRELMPESFLVD